MELHISVTGELPQTEPHKSIISTAIHECFTNALRHAHGDELHIEITDDEESLTAVFTNNGDQPAGEITENGGLKSLRELPEQVGGEMTIRSVPSFVIRPKLPKEVSLKVQLRQQAEALTEARIKATTDASVLSYTESYYHTAYEVQRGLGVGWTMQAINRGEVEKLLSRPWTVDNQTFRAHCWTDKTKLVETVNQELTRMIATGEAPDKAIAAIAKRFNVSKQNAGRVVMTESAYFSSAAQKDCFNDLGVELYKVVGTLDSSTCDTCGEMDGKVFKMGEYQVGATAPPFHPWCRCCTAPYFEDMEGMGERYARDAVTGERYKLPKDTTYKEWKAQQDAAHGAGTVDKMRKERIISARDAADQRQFAAYKSRLGKEAPSKFADFQAIKYNTPAAWTNLSGFFRYKGNNPNSGRDFYNANEAAKVLREANKIKAKGYCYGSSKRPHYR